MCPCASDEATVLKLGKWQKRILRVLGSAALVVGIFWFIPLQDVVVALREANVWYAVGSFVLTQVIAYLEGIQLWLLLRRARVPVSAWDVFETKMITRFYGQFLPSELMASASRAQGTSELPADTTTMRGGPVGRVGSPAMPVRDTGS